MLSPVNEMLRPVDGTENFVNEIFHPVNEMLHPVDEIFHPVNEMPYPVNRILRTDEGPACPFLLITHYLSVIYVCGVLADSWTASIASG